MGKKYKNNIETTSGFSYTAESPIDDRFVQSLLSDLSSLVTNKNSYDEMIVGVVSKGTYRYNKANNKWIRLANTKTITRNSASIEVLDETLDDNSVDTINIKSSAVTTSKIANKSITKDKMASNAITSDNIESPISIEKGGTGKSTFVEALKALNGVPIEKYIGSEINNPNVGVICMWDNGATEQDLSIGPDACGVVITSEFLDESRVFLADGHYIGRQIFITEHGDIYTRMYDTMNYSSFEKVLIKTDDITDANITTAKLANLVVSTVKLADKAVTAAKLGDSSVETAKIKDEAITENKLSDDLNSILIKGSFGTAAMQEGSSLETGKIYIQYDI